MRHAARRGRIGAAAAFGLVTLSAVAPGAGAAPTRELKGLWVVRTALVSPESVDRVVDEAARAGFTTLFVQVRGRGDAFYRSRLVVRSPLLSNRPQGFDPLARVLERARERGLEVHAWVNVLLTAHFGVPLPSGHVLRRHPDWVMVPKAAVPALPFTRSGELLRLVGQAARGDDDVEGYYLSPSLPAVGDHLEEVVRELVGAYAVSGLHLDFIRYPGPDYDYSRAARAAFRKVRMTDGAAGAAREADAFDAFRRSAVTSLVRRLTEAARTTRPGTVVSAAVTPDAGLAVGHRFQDWPRWVEAGLLDAICPMAYTPESRLFRAQIEDAVARTPPGLKVWAGVGAYRLSLLDTVERIRLAREAGAGGVVLFSHESLGRGDLDRLRELAFAPAGASLRAAPVAGAQ